MHDQDIVRIPLRARDGSIRCYVTIDAADADFANQWRWCFNGLYASRQENGTTVYLHRRLMGCTPGDETEVDHKDLDKLNCRRSNLRVVTGRGNRQSTGSRVGSSSYRGVYWHKAAGKWMAYVGTSEGGKRTRHYLGLFTDEAEAGAAARAGRARLLPESLH